MNNRRTAANHPRVGQDCVLAFNSPVQVPLAVKFVLICPTRLRCGNNADNFRPPDFRYGLPDLESFPFDIWRKLLARHIRARAPAAGRTFIDPDDVAAWSDPVGGAAATHPIVVDSLAQETGVSRNAVT